MNREQRHFGTVFGLGFDIEKDEKTRSGFRPAEQQFKLGLWLYSKLRLMGFVTLLRRQLADELVIVSGLAGRYGAENISQASVIRNILVEECDINPDRVRAMTSAATTGGNLGTINLILKDEELDVNNCAVMTNHYHLPRVMYDLADANLLMRPLAAEAIWLAGADSDEEFEKRMVRLVSEFCPSAITGRLIEEIAGMARKLAGTHIPRMSNADPHPHQAVA